MYDAYVAAFSNCLFWLASYGYFNKKVWWPIPLIVAAFNHPYVLIASLFFAVKSPYLVIPLSAIMTYFLIATELFTQETFFPIYTIFMGFARIIANVMPIMVFASKKKAKFRDFKLFSFISNVKMKMPTLFAVLLILVPTFVTVAIYVLVYQPDNVVDFTMFEGIPVVNGTVRVVDYLYLPSVYILPYSGFTLEAGSFRENNPQHMVKTTWENATQYISFLAETNISYVLFCVMCNPQSNEKEMLDNYSTLIWENDYYALYDVR
jgi:hypothetical protein